MSFHPIRGEQDADALYAVQTGRMAHDKIDPFCASEGFPTRDDLHAELVQVVAENRQDQWLVAQIDEQVIGYSQIESWLEGDGTWVYLTLGWVLPKWRGRGIGTAMLHWTEERIRRLAAADGACASPNKCEFAANARNTEKEATTLLLHEGYRAGYTVLEMGLDTVMPVPAHPLPAGIEVRPVSPDQYALIAASIHESYHQEYEGGRFEENWDAARYVAELSQPKHDAALWQVAWDGGQIAGQVMSVIEKGRAEVFEVSVRPAWRRRGLARALLSRALRTLRERGMDVIRLRTVAEFRTHARDLYGSVGFHVLKEFPRYRKPFNAPKPETISARPIVYAIE